MRLFLVGLALAPAAALAGPALVPGTPVLDRPTLMALGIQLPISGDDNMNASVTVRYRVAGSNAWFAALPLHRVDPSVVTGRTVAAQFAGSIFDLRPNTSYEIELTPSDPDAAP